MYEQYGRDGPFILKQITTFDWEGGIKELADFNYIFIVHSLISEFYNALVILLKNLAEFFISLNLISVALFNR